MRILLIGFGTVGQGLAQILRDKQDDLQRRYNFAPRIVGVATHSRGSLYHPDGLNLDALLAIGSRSLSAYPPSDTLARDWSPERMIREARADVVIEATWSDLTTAQPALDYCRTALTSGRHLVLANKGPVALAYTELHDLAQANNVRLLCEATVMAGTPTLRLALAGLAGCTIRSARGILNGTTNYMLTRMAEGLDYNQALAEAQSLGYAEADPTADVDGWDAAGKALILAQVVFGVRLAMSELSVQGIRHLTPADLATAANQGERYRLIATLTPTGGQIAPVRLPISDPLASISGATNAITFDTDLLGPITLIGAGAGRLETGFALLADLLALHTSLF